MFEFLKKKKPVQMENENQTQGNTAIQTEQKEETSYEIPVEPIVPLEDPRFQNATAELTVTMSPDPDEEPEEDHEETEVETDVSLIPVTDDVRIFSHEQFGEMRVVMQDGEPWFVATDVCKALEIGNSRQATSRLDEDEKFTTVISNDSAATGVSSMTFVSEPGLYSLVLSSRKPEAKAFKRWITHEVIPAIRKTGGYIAGESQMSDEELVGRALQIVSRKLEAREYEVKRLTTENAKLECQNMELNQQIETNAPKVRFAESFRDADGCVSISELAKLLCERGYQTGEKRLFETLREEGYLCKEGHDRNNPTQRWLEMAKPIFVLRACVWEDSDGQSHQYTKTMVTPAGITYFFKHFLGEEFRKPVVERRDHKEAILENAVKGRAVLKEMTERCAEIIRDILESAGRDRTQYVTIEEIRNGIPGLEQFSACVVGRGLKANGVAQRRMGSKIRYQMPASLFSHPEPVPAVPFNSHNARTELIRLIITTAKNNGASMTLMTSDQFLSMNRDKLGDMSVASVEAAFRSLNVESDTSYGTLLWKLPA